MSFQKALDLINEAAASKDEKLDLSEMNLTELPLGLQIYTI